MTDGIPLFSVVTINRDNEAGLHNTLVSVDAQQQTLLEHIVIDGASKDGSAALLRQVTNPRRRFISEPDTGIYNAMNKGLRACAGKFVIFMNSGDCFFEPTTLKRVSATENIMEKTFIWGDAVEKSGETEFYKKGHPASAIAYSMITHHQSMFYDRVIAQQLGFDESFRLAADWDFTMRYLRRAQMRSYLPFPICKFDRGGASFTANRKVAEAELWRVYRQTAHHSWPIATALYGLKVGINAARRLAPSLYDVIRLRPRA